MKAGLLFTARKEALAILWKNSPTRAKITCTNITEVWENILTKIHGLQKITSEKSMTSFLQDNSKPWLLPVSFYLLPIYFPIAKYGLQLGAW